MDKDNKMEEKYDLATGCLSEDGVIKIGPNIRVSGRA